MTKAFEGKVVLVTGANSGIGEAIAVAFEQAGATVFGLGRRQEALEAGTQSPFRHPLAPRGPGQVRRRCERRSKVLCVRPVGSMWWSTMGASFSLHRSSSPRKRYDPPPVRGQRVRHDLRHAGSAAGVASEPRNDRQSQQRCRA